MQKQWRWIVLMLLMAGLGQMAWGLNSATLTIAGSEQQLSGGWDQNSVTVAFNGFQETVQYGEYSTAASVASALAGKFSNDYLDDGLCAHASGAQITFELQGTATFGSLLVGGATTSFQVTSPTGFLSIATKADSGTVTLTVNGVTAATTNYGEGSTPETIADGLADGLQKGSPVSVTADGAAIELTSTAAGANTNYSYSLTTTYDSADFSQPSFSASPASGDLQGGAAANTNGTTVYSYCMPSPNNPNPSCQTSTLNGYDGDGNVTAVVDSVMGTWGYGYDTLNRLALSADNDPNIPYAYYCWSYDQWGNRTQQVGSTTAFPADAGGPYICNSSQPSFSYNTNNQITASPTGAPTYDAAGDITTGTSGNLYLYDAEGRICAVEKGDLMTGYVYDAAGNRVAKGPITAMSCDPTKNGFESSGQESDYILNQSGQPVTKTTMDSSGAMQWVYTNVYADGQLFATYDSSIEGNAGLYFLLNDWLGTRRVTTDYTGLLVQTCSSLPYGDETNCTTAPNVPNEQHFTGKMHDAESGLDYFGARYYSENDARFMSPDWSAKVGPVPYAKLSDPQSLNLYGYMLDSPLDGVDQDGHQDGAILGGPILITPAETQRLQRFIAQHPLVQLGLAFIPGGAEEDVLADATVLATEDITSTEEIAPVEATPSGGEEDSTPAAKKSQTGSYTNTHESGKTYDGKGDQQRSQASGRRVEAKTGDKHVSTDWTPAANDREAFKDESRRLDSHGGPQSSSNYNERESPGKKYRQQDGTP